MIGIEPRVDVAVSTHGPVERTEKAYARDKVARLFRMAGSPVLHASVRLIQELDPARERGSVAEATLDVDGRFARAHVAAATMHEAVDLLEAKLRRRLLMLAERAEAKHLRHRGDPKREWRHGDLPSHRPQYFVRMPDEREIVRRKTFALEAMTPDEAAFEMEVLAHDFYLFTDLDSGTDSLLYRHSDGGYGLMQHFGVETDLSTCAAAISQSERVPARLTEPQAVELLDLSEEPFVFFLDEDTGRGSVLYRRYDGHYGLVTPTA